MRSTTSIARTPSPARADGPPAIDVRGLTRRHGDRLAVDRLDLTVRPGRVTGFVGPNGAGKTTTIRMLLGLVRPTAGTGTVLGEPLAHPARYLARVGALIEGPAFLPRSTACDNLLMLARLDGNEDRIRPVLEQVGLADRRDDRVADYSLGMRQRLGIAAALLPDPALLILDEPTNGLDPAGIREIRGLLADLARAGTTVLVSSHLLGEIQAICDDLVVLRQGRRLFSGPLEDLLAVQGPRLMVRPEFADDAPRLRDVVASLDLTADAAADGGLAIRAGAEHAPALNRAAMQEGITLRELRAEIPDLEATFLAMTAQEG